jgi:hypothetical protein
VNCDHRVSIFSRCGSPDRAVAVDVGLLEQHAEVGTADLLLADLAALANHLSPGRACLHSRDKGPRHAQMPFQPSQEPSQIWMAGTKDNQDF